MILTMVLAAALSAPKELSFDYTCRCPHKQCSKLIGLTKDQIGTVVACPKCKKEFRPVNMSDFQGFGRFLRLFRGSPQCLT